MTSDKFIKIEQIKALITSECNLNCTHCFRSFDKQRYSISLEKLIELVDFAVDSSCNSISFSGGEFFVHPNAYDLLDYCFRKKLRVKVLTNATSIDRLDFFKKYEGTNLISFQISLDGMKDEHDARRGKGVFDLVTHNVKRIHKLGIETTVSMTVDQHNMYDVIDVLNIPYFDNYNFLPVAFAGEKTKEGRPIIDDKYLEYEEIIRTIYKSRSESLDESYRCKMFPYQIGVKYDGSVYPCAVARDYGIFHMGNINERSISDIVNDYFLSDLSSEIRDYSNNDIEECNRCDSKNKCNRGCRARAYKFFGRLLAPDPFCCKLYKCGFEDIPIGCIFWGEK